MTSAVSGNAWTATGSSNAECNRHEAKRAEQQYQAVDPTNRLVGRHFL